MPWDARGFPHRPVPARHEQGWPSTHGDPQATGPAPQPRGTDQAHLEDLLHDPAVVLLEGQLVGLGGVDTDEVGVVLVALAVTDALQEDLDEAEASAAQTERLLAPSEPEPPEPEPAPGTRPLPTPRWAVRSTPRVAALAATSLARYLPGSS